MLTELQRYCKEHGIVIEAYGSINAEGLTEEASVNALAQKYGKTAAQVLLRWAIQHGFVILPKSVTPSRIEENFNVFDFELTGDEVRSLDGLNKNKRFYWDPTLVKVYDDATQ